MMRSRNSLGPADPDIEYCWYYLQLLAYYLKQAINQETSKNCTNCVTRRWREKGPEGVGLHQKSCQPRNIQRVEQNRVNKQVILNVRCEEPLSN
jgi:hypothetical protein